jgi:hypothetical protein
LAVETNNFRRLLRTVEALSELGPELTAEREFSDTASRMLAAVMEAAGASEGALFVFNEKPTMLTWSRQRASRCCLSLRLFPFFPSTLTLSPLRADRLC